MSKASIITPLVLVIFTTILTFVFYQVFSGLNPSERVFYATGTALLLSIIISMFVFSIIKFTAMSNFYRTLTIIFWCWEVIFTLIIYVLLLEHTNYNLLSRVLISIILAALFGLIFIIIIITSIFLYEEGVIGP